MGIYTSRQLALLLLLVGAAGAGLGVRHWRAAHPELAERLERIDRATPRETDGAVGQASPSGRTRSPRPSPGVDAERSPARSRGERPARVAKYRADDGQALDGPLDLNHATLFELTRLPGVGPVLARRIIDTRADVGSFAAVDELARIRGVSRAKLERLRPLVAVAHQPGDEPEDARASGLVELDDGDDEPPVPETPGEIPGSEPE